MLFLKLKNKSRLDFFATQMQLNHKKNVVENTALSNYIIHLNE